MGECLIIELMDGIRYAIIDQINYNNNIYCLATEVDEDMNVSSEFKIKLYKVEDNILEDIEETEELNEIFEERLNKKEIELEILKNINFDDLIELTIKDIKDNIYYVDYNNKELEIIIEFYTNTKPQIGDKMYLDKKLLNEALLSYGYINNLENLYNEDLLIIIHDNNKIYYRRYYG